MIALTPPPPYYAVIFTSIKMEETPGYEEMATLMVQLAEQQEGFLGIESELGKKDWYSIYKTRICFVERDYNSLD